MECDTGKQVAWAWRPRGVLLEQPSHRTAKLMTQIHSSVIRVLPICTFIHQKVPGHKTVYATEIVTCHNGSV